MLKDILESLFCLFPIFYCGVRNLCGSQDWEKQAFLRIIKPGWSIIDVGANQGYYTNFFLKLVRQKGVIHAFEPIPSTFQILKNNVKYKNNCFIHNVGVSSKNEVAQFFSPIEDSGKTSMKAHSCKLWNSLQKDIINSEVIRIDDFYPLQKLTKIDLIKIDTEGAELLVLKGAKETIKRNKPKIIFEACKECMKSFEYSVNDLDDFFSDLDYTNFRIVNKNLNSITSINDFFIDKKDSESFNILASYN